jgi:Lrp/AsnC family leucine-responsive transcriptional regulator
MNSEARLDNVDWQILQELQQNARTSFSEIGRRVGLTSPAVAERVRRMEDAGIIEGYRADINLAKIGYPLQAIIRITLTGDSSQAYGTTLSRLPEVLECYRVTGEDSFFLRCALESPEHLDRLIFKLTQFGTTKTSLVLAGQPGKQVIPAPRPD